MHPLTHPRLREIAAHLEAVRARLTDVVEATPRATMLASRARDRWSGAQIVQHLGKVEGATVKMLEGMFGSALASGLPADPVTSSLLSSLDRFEVTDGALRPLVAPERLRPSPDADLDVSWASLVTVRERTYRAFAAVDGRDLTVVSAPHPYFGPLNGYEWFLFLGKHEERHLGQLKQYLAGSA